MDSHLASLLFEKDIEYCSDITVVSCLADVDVLSEPTDWQLFYMCPLSLDLKFIMKYCKIFFCHKNFQLLLGSILCKLQNWYTYPQNYC